MVIVDGGKLMSCSPAVRDPGTTIEVKSLFFNVPVRKKFLKSPTIDENEIAKIMTILALGNPNIKFQLISDEKKLLTTPPSTKSELEEKLKDRIGTVLGQDFIQNCTYVHEESEGVSLYGLVGLPTYTRHTRTGQYLFINQRPVTSPLISFAVREGYGTALIQGRHPVFVLYLNMPGELVDVNVHPQKKEVRLRQEQIIRDLISRGVERALMHKETPTPTFSSAQHLFAKAAALSEVPLAPKPTTPAWTFQPKPAAQPMQPPKPVHAPLIQPQEIPMSPPKLLASIPRYLLLECNGLHPFFSKASSQASKGGLMLIDQKAAHTRVIFETLLRQKEKGKGAQQLLLIPHQMDVSAAEAELIKNSLSFLNGLGIQVKEFGPRTFLIEALPQIFGNCHIELLISDLISSLRQDFAEQEALKQLAMTASKSSVNGESKLSYEEGQALVQQLVQCKHPYQCPQGRPTCYHVLPEEIAKFFQKPYVAEK